MSTQGTPQAEPVSRLAGHSQDLFQVLERNRGRLQVLEYACFGLSHSHGRNAGCLVWILADMLADLDRVAGMLEESGCRSES